MKKINCPQESQMQIEEQESNSQVFLDSKKCYHHFIGHNLNSIILQFLRVEDLEQLFKVDKIFAKDVVNTLRIIKRKFINKLKELNSIQVSEELEDASTLYFQNFYFGSQVQLNQYLSEAMEEKQPNPNVQLTVQTLMNIFSIPQKQTHRENINTIIKVNKETAFFILENQLVEFDERQIQILESFFKTLVDKQTPSLNFLCKRIYITLKINFLVNKYKLTQDELLNYEIDNIKRESYIEQLQSYYDLSKQLVI